MITEIDMLGNRVARWHAARAFPDGLEGSIPLDIWSLHHAFRELPNGNLLAMSIEQRELEDYPTSEEDPGAAPETTKVIGDVIVEFTRAGEIVKEWRCFEILDPFRIGYGSLGGFWWGRGYPDSCDWSHCNGIDYDPRDDSMLLSFRCQDAVVKLQRSSGDIVWILGPHDNWRKPWSDKLLTPDGDLEWQYHQHDPSLTSRGSVMLFDNGTFRATPLSPKRPATQNYTRILEVEVDEAARRVREVWAYGGPGIDAPYSTYVGGATALPQTGNVLINYSGVILDRDGGASDRNREEHNSIHVMEVTRTQPAERLFHLTIDTHESGDQVGWGSFRIEHAESLYF